MGSTERIRNVAKRVAKWARAGHQMVVVPSAMSGETNRLLGLAKELLAGAADDAERTRELDMLAATGEQVSVGAAGASRCRPRAWRRSATPAGRCRSAPTAPTPRRASSRIDDKRVRADLAAGKVVIITGFQGVDERRQHHHAGPRRQRHLGRGGGGGDEGRRVPDLHRRRRRLHHRPARRARGAPPADRELRGDAGDGQPGLQGAADPLGRIRRQVPGAAARAVELHAVGHPHRRRSHAPAR